MFISVATIVAKPSSIVSPACSRGFFLPYIVAELDVSTLTPQRSQGIPGSPGQRETIGRQTVSSAKSMTSTMAWAGWLVSPTMVQANT